MKKITFISVVALIICAVMGIQNVITLFAAYIAAVGTGYEILPKKQQEKISSWFIVLEEETTEDQE